MLRGHALEHAMFNECNYSHHVCNAPRSVHSSSVTRWLQASMEIQPDHSVVLIPDHLVTEVSLIHPSVERDLKAILILLYITSLSTFPTSRGLSACGDLAGGVCCDGAGRICTEHVRV